MVRIISAITQIGWVKSPFPFNRGYWGAFGHVSIDGTFSALITPIANASNLLGYEVDYTAQYVIEDTYRWCPDGICKETPIPGYPGANIPHTWALSLDGTNSTRAYDFTITWQGIRHGLL